MRGRIASALAAIRRTASTTTIATLSLALACTLFGAGALGGAVRLSDGQVWLWSSPVGELSRIDADDGRVDLTTEVPESAGNSVEITQTDDHLILHDLDTGRMTSIDLSDMAFSGRLDLAPDDDHGVFLDGDRGIIVDRREGEVRAIDPATFTATGEALKLPAPLVGGGFDAQGTFWVGAPGQGTVTGIRTADGAARADTSIGVADPADDVVLTVRDQGPLVVNRSDDTITEVRGGRTAEVASPVDLSDAVVPPTMPGGLVAVTVPGADTVLTLPGPHDGDGVAALPAEGIGSGIAVPYEGRVYLPGGDDRVRVFGADGAETDPLEVPGGEGPIGLEAREGHLFVNSPGSGAALVIGPSGEAVEIDKYAPPPGPGGPPSGAPENGQPEGQGPQAEPGDGASPPAGPQDGAADEPEEEPGRPAIPPDLDPGTEPEGPVEPALPEPSGPPPGTGPGDLPLPVPGTGSAGTGTPAGSSGTAGLGPVPGAPLPVTASVEGDRVAVAWQPAYSASPITGYAVSWEGGSTTVSGDSTGTVIDGLPEGVAVSFRVQAANAHGYGAAAVSEAVVAGEQAPPTPEDVDVAVTGAGSALLSWSAAPGAHDYAVTGAVPDTATGGSRITVYRATSATSITVSGLEPGGTYTLAVAARTEGGAQSTAAAAPAVTLPYLDAPDRAWAEVRDDGTIAVYWRPVAGAANYLVSPAGSGLQQVTVPHGEPVTIDREEFQTAVFQGGGGRCHSFTVQASDAAGRTGLTGDRTGIVCEDGAERPVRHSARPEGDHQ
ncbi:fibronectin type III domain-containing protein [Nocardiopsis sediminis]|uniref:Fibronectin type III domain-containing protein n=1 Tax=Nocardiopsis sediminis TaxID=1778267 RepID=A0ABV8FRX9_9ACTN